jgi:hypothetical protein
MRSSLPEDPDRGGKERGQGERREERGEREREGERDGISDYIF